MGFEFEILQPAEFKDRALELAGKLAKAGR
jgi:hypothetical protein